MAKYALRNGYRVEVRRVEGQLEFSTINTEGDVIATVRRTYAASVPVLTRLESTRA